jgi:hypothetical protein
MVVPLYSLTNQVNQDIGFILRAAASIRFIISVLFFCTKAVVSSLLNQRNAGSTELSLPQYAKYVDRHWPR